MQACFFSDQTLHEYGKVEEEYFDENDDNGGDDDLYAKK